MAKLWCNLTFVDKVIKSSDSKGSSCKTSREYRSLCSCAFELEPITWQSSKCFLWWVCFTRKPLLQRHGGESICLFFQCVVIIMLCRFTESYAGCMIHEQVFLQKLVLFVVLWEKKHHLYVFISTQPTATFFFLLIIWSFTLSISIWIEIRIGRERERNRGAIFVVLLRNVEAFRTIVTYKSVESWNDLLKIVHFWEKLVSPVKGE